MKGRLFPNIRQMTTTFCVCIVGITVILLILRLTVLDEVVADPPSRNGERPSSGEGESDDYRISTQIYFATPTAQGEVLIENPAANDYYMIVDVRLNSTGTSVYYSGYIRPGTSIHSAGLQGEELEEGVYPCTATITARDMDTREILAVDTVDVTIYVGEKPR